MKAEVSSLLFYYEYQGMLVCGPEDHLPLPPWQGEPAGERGVYLFRRDPANSRAAFSVNHPGQLWDEKEDVHWLDASRMPKGGEAPPFLLDWMKRGNLRGVNLSHPRWRELLDFPGRPGKKRVHILAIGDVGSTLLTGLRLLGGDVISAIGICDLSDQISARWEMEMNQVSLPWDYDAFPPVEVIPPERLFDCDLFAFVASKGIPPVGAAVTDVRMAQLEANAAIVTHYARQARQARFRGLWAAVSDPVDPLAKVAYWESNRDEQGNFDGKGLLAQQIQGFGLGVMNARAAYYAKKAPRFASFLTQGRAYGPHGEDLIIANSIEQYDDALSQELTKLAVTANLKMRELGYKAYVAPALSSGALSLLLSLRGDWHYSSVYLGGAFLGVKNRWTPAGVETEVLPHMPDDLFARIRAAADNLRALL